MHKKVASIVTATALIVTMSTTAVIATPLSDKLKQQQSQMQEHKTNYDNVQRKLEKLEQKIEQFDQQIEDLMRDINANKSKIKSIQNNIESSKKEIEKAEKDIKEEQELYNQRVRTMYMNGVGGYLDVILGAEDFGDLVQKVEAVKQLTELDKKIVKELKGKQDNLRKKQETLNSEKEKLVSLNKEQESKADKIKKDRDEQDKFVKEARKQRSLYAGALKNDEAQINKTKRMIQDMKSKTYSKRSSSSKRKNSISRGSASVSSDSVVSYASNFLGCRYVWGAEGPDTFDCSGFVGYVYANFGVRLPRVSSEQATVGTYVSRDELQPGDLVFFGTSRIHHVGIYVGNDTYIHAPRTGDVVKYSSLSGRSDYATARRVR